MNIHPSRQAANTLLVVMMITGLIMAALGTYLTLTSQEHATVHRSICWNAALPMAEAGIEETLSHLNQNKTNYAADGWTTNYNRHRTLGEGYYDVGFTGKPGSVITITSTGYVRLKDDQFVSRIVRIRGLTTKDFKFPGLMANAINFGGNLSADSYDSTDTNASTGGMYDSKKAGDQVLVATPGLGFSMGGSSKILGFVATGPGGSVTVGGACSVGDKNYKGKGIQMSPINHFTNNFTLTVSSVEVPYTEADAPTFNTVNGTNYDYVLEGNEYFATNLNSSVYGGTMLVKQSSVLYVTGVITLNKIIFAPGERLDLYVGGPTISFAPAIVGATAPQFTVFVLPTCASFNLNSSTLFTGLIYAPDTALAANGTADIAGAIACKSFSCNGTFTFHYDLAFSKPRVIPPVRILSWAEL